MPLLRNGEWRLVYPGTDYTFGTGATETFNLSAPDLGDVPIRSSDADRPRQDGVVFGADFRGPRTITFDLGLKGADEAEIRDALGRLSAAWSGRTIRNVPGAVAELHMQYRDRERVVFGRPRRFAPNITGVRSGLGAATADFLCTDDLFYGAEEFVASVGLVATPGGGLIAPLASPLSTTASSDRSVGIDVNSDVPVWPVIEIEGPITNPSVEVVGLWRMEFRTTLAYDQRLVIDTRPWARTVLRNGASVAGSLTRQSVRLSKAAIPSGRYEIAFRGTSETGTPTVTFRWRNAYPTP